MARRDNPAYAHFFAGFRPDYEMDAEGYNARYVTEDAIEAGRRRRRIEDLAEGLRLDRDIFREVWEE